MSEWIKNSRKQLLSPYMMIVFGMAIGGLFAPQVSPNDHQLNIEPLIHLNRVYENPAYVYPPQALTLMLPFYFIGAPLTRLLTILIVGYYGLTRQWSVWRLLACYANPIFLYALLFTNIDIFVVLLPLLFFERSNTVVRALLLSVLMLKPHLSFFYAIYLVIRYRAWAAVLLGASFTLAQFVIPDAAGVPLVQQWMDNIRNPTAYNIHAWTMNEMGPRWFVLLVFPLLYFVSSRANPAPKTTAQSETPGRTPFIRLTSWSQDHTAAALLMLAMTISPYTSYQSVLVPVVLMASAPLTVVHWIMAGFGITTTIYYFLTTLLFSVIAIRRKAGTSTT